MLARDVKNGANTKKDVTVDLVRMRIDVSPRDRSQASKSVAIGGEDEDRPLAPNEPNVPSFLLLRVRLLGLQKLLAFFGDGGGTGFLYGGRQFDPEVAGKIELPDGKFV